jgi:hypothetical protein
MISRAYNMLFIALVGGFPALWSMGLAPCCMYEASLVHSSSCCQHLETPGSENSLPLDHQEICMCSLGFFAIQASSVSPDEESAGSFFDLSHWIPMAAGQPHAMGPPASGASRTGRALRLQISSLIC